MSDSLSRRRSLQLGAALLLGTALAGCASTPATPIPDGPIRAWSGRLSLVLDQDPPQSFIAGFELAGKARRGTLGLFNPLGSQMAQIRWMPGVAELQQGNHTRAYPDLDTLVTEVTGTNVPVTSLFDWLDGRPTPVPGWEPDLSQRSQGRLIAKRLHPQPTARLQLVIESVDADAP